MCRYSDQPFKEVILVLFAVPKEPTIELPAVFIKVELQESLVYVFMYGLDSTSAFPGNDMYSWQDFCYDVMGIRLCF